jgi:threonine aldolase
VHFGSDNVVGASRKVLDAIVAANDGAMPSYGEDALAARVKGRLRDLFEHEVEVFMVPGGTAANGLSLACLSPPWGEIFCHEESHVMTDECGAPENFTGGAKLVGLQGVGGKIGVDALRSALEAPRRGVHSVVPAALTLTNLTECGTLYRPDEVAALAGLARRHGLKVHMDGARFANAIAGSGASPAEMTWKAGIDVLSLGATKNGALAAEAVVFFDPALAESMPMRRMRGGLLVSKGRLLSSQFEAWLDGDHWLDLARHANTMAARLRNGLAAVPGIRVPWPAEGNEVFPVLPERLERALLAQGFRFHRWRSGSLPDGGGPGAGEALVRMVCSFATREEDVDKLIAAAAAATEPSPA